MAELRVEGLVKQFGTVRAVDDISFTVRDGEFLTLLGPSGCGKSTTLAAIAGLDQPDGGVIRSATRSSSTARAACSCRRRSARSAWSSSPTRCGRT